MVMHKRLALQTSRGSHNLMDFGKLLNHTTPLATLDKRKRKRTILLAVPIS